MGNVVAALQYGALGLLAVVIVGFFWYVRSVEARAAKREDAEQKRQEKYIEALVKSTTSLAILISRQQSHDKRMQEEHSRLQEEHSAIVAACDFPGKGLGQ